MQEQACWSGCPSLPNHKADQPDCPVPDGTMHMWSILPDMRAHTGRRCLPLTSTPVSHMHEGNGGGLVTVDGYSGHVHAGPCDRGSLRGGGGGFRPPGMNPGFPRNPSLASLPLLSTVCSILLRAPARQMVIRLMLCPCREGSGVQGTSQTAGHSTR